MQNCGTARRPCASRACACGHSSQSGCMAPDRLASCKEGRLCYCRLISHACRDISTQVLSLEHSRAFSSRVYAWIRSVRASWCTCIVLTDSMLLAASRGASYAVFTYRSAATAARDNPLWRRATRSKTPWNGTKCAVNRYQP
eukprot:3783196-Prymnesium_polylepis.1